MTPKWRPISWPLLTGSYELEKLGMTYYNQEFPKAAAYLEEGAFGPLADPVGPNGRPDIPLRPYRGPSTKR